MSSRRAVASEVYTVSARRERDVGAVVHEDADPGPARQIEGTPNDPAQQTGIEVALAKLNEIDARIDRLSQKMIQRGRRRPPSSRPARAGDHP